MSYKVTIDEYGTAYPQFYCDVCREPIEALEEGNTIFSSKVLSGRHFGQFIHS
jgi:hypothetical protein